MAVLCAVDIFLMRVTAQEFNNTTKYGPYGELCLFLVRIETDPIEAVRAFLLSLCRMRCIPLVMTLWVRRRSECLLGLDRAALMAQKRAMRGF